MLEQDTPQKTRTVCFLTAENSCEEMTGTLENLNTIDVKTIETSSNISRQFLVQVQKKPSARNEHPLTLLPL